MRKYHFGYLIFFALLFIAPIYFLFDSIQSHWLNYLYFGTNIPEQIERFAFISLVSWFLYFLVLLELFIAHHFNKLSFIVYENSYQRLSSTIIPVALLMYPFILWGIYSDGYNLLHFIFLHFIALTFLVIMFKLNDIAKVKIEPLWVWCFLFIPFFCFFVLNILTLLFWL